MEQVGKADPFQELRAHAVGNAVDDLSAIVGGVDMDTQRTTAMKPRNPRSAPYPP